MQLRAYLDDRKITIPAFAAAIGVSVQAVHRYVAGDRVPRKEVMARIKAATDGKVQPNDFHTCAEQAAA
jgi:Helix-turn-helix